MTSTGPNAEQAQLWNGPAGRAWVDAQVLLDALFAPVEAFIVEAVAARSPGALLDVGCGTGAVTLAAARRLGPAARCLGVDVSEPMIAAARARAEREGVPAAFVRADAEGHPFEPASVEMIVSRFGVMFFTRPVEAFVNLRRAARPGAALLCVAFRDASENPFMTAAERAAAPLLPNLPPRRPGAPGQFAFANADRVHAILDASGWREIDVRPADIVCSMPEAALVPYFTRLGPVGLALQEIAEPARGEIVRTVRAAFDPFVEGGEVRFTAACWRIGALA
jgi:SAM-dependent methyltransferase